MLKPSNFNANIEALFINSNRDLSLATETPCSVAVDYHGLNGGKHKLGTCAK